MRTLLFALSFVTGTIPAMAADLPVKAPPAPAPYYGLSWTGLYAGANGGYGWNVTGITDFAGFTAGNPPQGPMGGAQIGYDKQLDNLLVIGVRADLDVVSLRTGIAGVSASTTMFGTVDARVGALLSPDIMLYGVGGLAYADPKLSVGPMSSSKTALGWNAGGGLEVRMAPGSKWTGFVEAGYADAGKNTIDAAGLSSHLQFGYAKTGLNYRF